jgi:CRP-like cAMP-binding protein
VLQGQVGNGLYIVVSGAARVVQGADVLARLGPGDFFGELAVIDQQPRSASAYAEGPSSCLALASWDLMALLAEEPALALNLLRELASRLRRADAQLRH